MERDIDDNTVVAIYDYLSTVPVWMHQAQCVVDQITPSSSLPVDEILDSCSRCPVIEHCSKWAQSHDLHHGVYAGVDLSTPQK